MELLSAVAVSQITPRDGAATVLLSTGQEVSAGAVVIATGSQYRRTNAPGESDLIGAGVHFCATCDGPFYKGARDVTVLGGGNSGLEEGLFLTKFADHVTVIERGDKLAASKILQTKVAEHGAMDLNLKTSLIRFNAGEDDRLTSVTLAGPDGAEYEHQTTAVFVFIGLDPNTGWLDGLLDLDDRGFIATDRTMATSIPGVFAAGDVRSGSTKQLASAVGEGAAVSLQLRYYLEHRVR